mmetsp:Transcript_33050/g.43507  ORF Transcript_33050/g.43507 Transcript_33050/m.43507 type:complete len:191 (+) Transcript_33050:98-670(+)
MSILTHFFISPRAHRLSENIFLPSSLHKIPKSIQQHSKCSANHFDIFGSLAKKTDPSDIEVGDIAQLVHVFDEKSVKAFSQVCGDTNPLHLEEGFIEGTDHPKNLVHGILVSSLFSTIFGRLFPGSIYVSQQLNFEKPVYVGYAVKAVVSVKKKRNTPKGLLLICDTYCFDDISSTGVLSGKARVILQSR